MLISTVAKFVTKLYSRRFRLWQHNSVGLQQKVFANLMKEGKATAFGKEHDFKSIKNHHDFCQRVPIRDYEEFKPYINRIVNGERSVLWPGYPKYFAKTSGTTSGVKYIPITSVSMPNHINSARLVLIMYIYKTGNTKFINGKYMFISGSPELDKVGRIASGRLSGIVNHHVPAYIKVNQMPTYDTNCISDWETKLDSIVEETKNKRMTLISGIPPWVEMYFNRIIKETGKKTIGEVFPHFSLFVYGGVNFKPYERRFREIIGCDINSIETFPASEGFFAFQDEFPSKGLLLIPDSGIFYEFIPVEKFDDPNPPRLTINDIELDVNYALIVSTNAGLWAYSVGDTVKFVSKNPYRIIVTGRLSHFTSAFGEHVIADEVESSINEACAKFSAMLTEFTVAPLVHNPNGLPCHEWFIEFSRKPDNLLLFQEYLDSLMQQKNPYYKDLIKGKILQPLVIRQLQSGAFVKYMKSIGKLGGQNKVPHLKNDRSVADGLEEYVVE